MEVKGKVVKKLELESGISKSDKAWQKQIIVIDTGSEYNPEIAVQAFGEGNITQMNKLEVGDNVVILCNVSSREYNGRYFHNIDGYHFTKNTREAYIVEETINSVSESNDLPF